MEYRKLGNSGIDVSVIAFGAWGIGGYPFWETKGDKASIEALEASLDEGINFFDTAPVYGFGHSERIIGKTFKSKRDKVVIATKCGLRWKSKEMESIYNDLKPESVRAEVEDSLKRLETDYIDLYQIHWPSPTEEPEWALEEMAKMKEEGKIRAIGLSNFGAALTERALRVTRIDSNQPKYNILERKAEKDLLPFCAENSISAVVYSPLASGLLSGKYSSASSFNDWRGEGVFGIFKKETIGKAYENVERLKVIASDIGKPLVHIAINWVLANPAVTCALVGVKDAEQMRKNIKCLESPLTMKEKERIEKAIR